MADGVKPRVKVPKKAEKGEIIEIKTLISHKMESGQRVDRKTGEKIPRQIINKFTCAFNGKELFSADWHGAISANPYIAFFMKADQSGDLVLSWTDDNNKTVTATKKINVG